MLRRVALARADVSEERSASIMRVTRIGELDTTLAVTFTKLAMQRKESISDNKEYNEEQRKRVLRLQKRRWKIRRASAVRRFRKRNKRINRC
jgi:hypothetical protein